MSKFTDAVEHYLRGLDVSVGAAPGCDRCLDLPEITCDRSDCYTSEPCEDCEKSRREDPGNEWHDLANEGSFSWSQCDGCGSTLGGDRYPAHGWKKEEEDYSFENLFHLEVCTDCLMYLANGDEPDPEEWR